MSNFEEKREKLLETVKRDIKECVSIDDAMHYALGYTSRLLDRLGSLEYNNRKLTQENEILREEINELEEKLALEKTQRELAEVGFGGLGEPGQPL